MKHREHQFFKYSSLCLQ